MDFKPPRRSEALELPEGAQALPGGPECSVSLSPSSALLSVADGSAVTVYSTKSIAASPDAPEALRAVAFDEPVAQFEVQPGNEQRYAARLEDGSLLLGELGAAPVRAKEDLTLASCIAWAPNGETLAVASGDRVFLTDPEGAVQRSFRVKSLELQSDDDALAVDGLAWARPDALLVSSRVLAGGEPEPVAATCVVGWQGAQAEQLSLHELFALNIVPGRGQDALRCAAIPEWGALVYAHASAADDHVKVLLAGEGADGRGVAAADVVDDRLAIRVPNAPDDEDNYVTGLGVDRVAGRGRPVPNPVDPDAPDLPPQALLWLATSDGCLRAYTLGSVADRADIVKSEPRPLPDAPVVAGSSGAAGAALSGGDKPDAAAALSAAAAVPLADSDSDFGDEDSAGSNDDGDSSDAKSSGALDQPSAFSLPKPGQTELKPPAATAAPSAAPFGSAGFVFGGGAPQETPAAKPGGLFGGFGGASLPAASSSAFAFTPAAPAMFGALATPGGFSSLPSTPSVFGPPPPTPNLGVASEPSSSLTSSAAAPSGLFGAPASNVAAPPAKPPSKAASSSQPPLPSASQLQAAAALKARVLGAPAAGGAPESLAASNGSSKSLTAAASTTVPKASSAAKPPTSQPPMPSLSQFKASQALASKVLSGGGGSTGAKESGTGKAALSTKSSAPAVPPAKTLSPRQPAAVPEPPARLGGSEGIAAGIEADFLKSLLASRKLEAETHAAVTSALEKADAVSVSAGEIEECRRGVAAAQTALREQQRSAARLAQSVKVRWVLTRG